MMKSNNREDGIENDKNLLTDKQRKSKHGGDGDSGDGDGGGGDGGGGDGGGGDGDGDGGDGDSGDGDGGGEDGSGGDGGDGDCVDGDDGDSGDSGDRDDGDGGDGDGGDGDGDGGNCDVSETDIKDTLKKATRNPTGHSDIDVIYSLPLNTTVDVQGRDVVVYDHEEIPKITSQSMDESKSSSTINGEACESRELTKDSEKNTKTLFSNAHDQTKGTPEKPSTSNNEGNIGCMNKLNENGVKTTGEKTSTAFVTKTCFSCVLYY